MTQNATQPASPARFDLDQAIQSFKDTVDTASQLATDMRQLSASANPSPPTPDPVLQKLKALADQNTQGLPTLHQAAVQQHQEQINQVQPLVDDLDTTLEDPGLDSATRASVQSLLDVRRAELFHLNMQMATDYGDLLTAAEVLRIQTANAAAQVDVQNKKSASEAVGIAMSIADTSLFIAGKLAKAAIL